MMRVLVKEGVRFTEFNIFLLKIIKVLMDFGDQIGKEMVITSANDSRHKEDSLHYKSRALDVRIRHLTQDETNLLVNYLRAKLGGDYDVILEKDHIHVEYDPKDEKITGVGK